MEVLNPSVTGYKRLHPNLAMASSASSSIPSDSRVGRIVKCTVRALLERDGYRQEQALSLIDPVGQLGEDESIIVERVVDLVLRLVDDPRQPRRITVDELEQNDWPLQPDNVHSEFKTVATQIFSDDIHWGRIVSFLSFSSTYILFAMRRGMPESIVQSVCGWTTNFMERELRSWFQTHSWVSKNKASND